MLSNLSQNSQGCNKYTFCLYTSSHAASYDEALKETLTQKFLSPKPHILGPQGAAQGCCLHETPAPSVEVPCAPPLEVPGDKL